MFISHCRSDRAYECRYHDTMAILSLPFKTTCENTLHLVDFFKICFFVFFFYFSNHLIYHKVLKLWDLSSAQTCVAPLLWCLFEHGEGWVFLQWPRERNVRLFCNTSNSRHSTSCERTVSLTKRVICWSIVPVRSLFNAATKFVQWTNFLSATNFWELIKMF